MQGSLGSLRGQVQQSGRHVVGGYRDRLQGSQHGPGPPYGTGSSAAATVAAVHISAGSGRRLYSGGQLVALALWLLLHFPVRAAALTSLKMTKPPGCAMVNRHTGTYAHTGTGRASRLQGGIHHRARCPHRGPLGGFGVCGRLLLLQVCRT